MDRMKTKTTMRQVANDNEDTMNEGTDAVVPQRELQTSPDQSEGYRALARSRQNLRWCLSEAAHIRRLITSGTLAMDKEVEAGVRHKHDLLCLIAAAMPAASRDELLFKHEALAGVQALDPTLGDLATVLNAALCADWRRVDDERPSALNPFRLH